MLHSSRGGASGLGTEGFRVGLDRQWQGTLEYGRDRYRSIPLAAVAPLAAVPGVRLISVQARTGLAQLDALPAEMKVERLGAEIEHNADDFRDMAAVLANLDHRDNVLDTFSTHLAGALGRPVWLALPRLADWRWMRDPREGTPWYPTIRLFPTGRLRATGPGCSRGWRGSWRRRWRASSSAWLQYSPFSFGVRLASLAYNSGEGTDNHHYRSTIAPAPPRYAAPPPRPVSSRREGRNKKRRRLRAIFASGNPVIRVPSE